MALSQEDPLEAFHTRLSFWTSMEGYRFEKLDKDEDEDDDDDEDDEPSFVRYQISADGLFWLTDRLEDDRYTVESDGKQTDWDGYDRTVDVRLK